MNKILFITLSNIGDVILSLPVLDSLREKFPQAKITVICAARSQEIFVNNPAIAEVIVFDKRAKLKEKIRLFKKLKEEKFDIVVDLRNSFFGIFLPVKYKNLSFGSAALDIKHMKERHLFKLIAQSPELIGQEGKRESIFIKPRDGQYIDIILEESGITKEDRIIVISAGARSHTKRWPQERFVELISRIEKDSGLKIILVGDKEDAKINGYINEHLKKPVLDLSAKTSLMQLSALLKRADLVITNDSAVLHLSSYLNRPTVALFGPTNEEKYGPWSEICAVVKKDLFCRPCEKAQCKFGTLECLRLIKVEDVLRVVKDILSMSHLSSRAKSRLDYKRILIVRTDRIGDVLLSTPVIKAVRDKFPNAFIAMMVSPYAKEIVEGNPYLDQVIIYDKDSKHKSTFRSMKFSHTLRKKKFDLAIILHPTNRAHLMTFFAGISRRIGYNRKFGFLLTDRFLHTKQAGEKHESEYNLDLLKPLGIKTGESELHIHIKPESQIWADEILSAEGIRENDKILCIHPGASCPSKIWPNERFAQVADKLVERYGFKVVVVSGPKDTGLAEALVGNMKNKALNLGGRSSVNQLAALIKRSSLFISNDSGPVHIASAVGTPVISIFGRDQAGLSPKRWGPVGENDKFIHKPIGCIECLAHNCVKEFACLRAISVEDVLAAAESILSDEK